MNSIKNRIIKISILFLGLIYIVNITSSTYAKYLSEEIYTVANVNIDVTNPKIELLDIKSEENDYIDKTSIININLKLTEKNILENNFNKENIDILIENNKVIPHFYELKEMYKENECIFYKLKIKLIKESGNLNIKIKEGCVIDESNNSNQEIILETNISL